jgi:hypothetical protein
MYQIRAYPNMENFTYFYTPFANKLIHIRDEVPAQYPKNNNDIYLRKQCIIKNIINPFDCNNFN